MIFSLVDYSTNEVKYEAQQIAERPRVGDCFVVLGEILEIIDSPAPLWERLADGRGSFQLRLAVRVAQGHPGIPPEPPPVRNVRPSTAPVSAAAASPAPERKVRRRPR